MRKFMSRNLAFLFLVTILTIDASRIFYLPLPKIHTSHDEIKSLPTVQESEKKTVDKRSIDDDDFISYLDLEEHEIFDQDALVDNELRSRRFVEVKERSLGNEQDSEYSSSINRDRRQPDGQQASIDQISQIAENDMGQWAPDTANSRPEHLHTSGISDDTERRRRRNDVLFIVIVAICTVVGVAGLVAAAIFWYKIQKRAEDALDAEYPSYGVTGPGSNSTKISPSSTVTDRKLAQSAQMFHYQQQRQQMMAQEKSQLDAKPVHSDESDDEAPTGGDYTVYECPGLAPTGEMEVRNPLFAETNPSLTSVSHPTTNNHYPQLTTVLSSSTSPPKENTLP